MKTENGGQEPAALADSPEFLAINLAQQKFVLEYIKDFNGQRAATAAGYSERTARHQASRLLTLPNIQAALAVAQKSAAASLERDFSMSRKERMAILAKIANAKLKNVVALGANGVSFLPSEEINDDDLLTVKSISYSSSFSTEGASSSVSIATHDRVKAIELMSRMAGDINGESEDDSGKKPVAGDLQARLRSLHSKYFGPGK